MTVEQPTTFFTEGGLEQDLAARGGDGGLLHQVAVSPQDHQVLPLKSTRNSRCK